ncbi:hypothetical protein [Streptomyces anandii]|uniref:hypothetical protein n=1 Tax=Streptomyces anandii TaxID=285454 RepID=UPI00167890E0|nr:hypothetical protein [Streptomyces anandii]GGX86102.1 hypothetical protein GCM10010510_34000 [Streptomyces anandii JCM 4720]
MRQHLSKGMVVVGAATGILSLYGNPAFADSHTEGTAGGPLGAPSAHSVPDVSVDAPTSPCTTTTGVTTGPARSFGNSCAGGPDSGESHAPARLSDRAGVRAPAEHASRGRQEAVGYGDDGASTDDRIGRGARSDSVTDVLGRHGDSDSVTGMLGRHGDSDSVTDMLGRHGDSDSVTDMLGHGQGYMPVGEVGGSGGYGDDDADVPEGYGDAPLPSPTPSVEVPSPTAPPSTPAPAPSVKHPAQPPSLATTGGGGEQAVLVSGAAALLLTGGVVLARRGRKATRR